MITQFNIFENKVDLIYDNIGHQVYEYKKINFTIINGKYYLYFNKYKNLYQETTEMSYYFDRKYLGDSGIESSGEYLLGDTLEEAMKTIDIYWLEKESDKYNL